MYSYLFNSGNFFMEMWIWLDCFVLLYLWLFFSMYASIIHYKIIVYYSSSFLLTVYFNCFTNRFIKFQMFSSFAISVFKTKYTNLSHWVSIEKYRLTASLINFSVSSPLFIDKYLGIVVGLKLHSSIKKRILFG